MSKLTSSERNKLPKGDFGLPGQRKYPLNDPNHARNALARVAQHGTKSEKKEIREKVHDRFPGIAEHISKVTQK
jgi:uncharacterized protein DUF6582